MFFQNFSVCEDCSLLCGLFHRLQHVKQTMYVMCAEIVEKRKDDNPGIDTTQILNQLLADDVWLESVRPSTQSTIATALERAFFVPAIRPLNLSSFKIHSY
jgi:hypothetical protein